MADRPDPFLSRWSRRKRGDRAGDEEATAPEGAAAASAPQEPLDGDEDTEGDPELVAKLPDIESLDEASDFTPFMAKGVPEALRRRALRKLWRLNPAFSHLDGLNDYDEDFTAAAAVLTKIKTLYQVGKGMLGGEPAEEPAGSATPGEDPAAAAAPGAAAQPLDPPERPSAPAPEDAAGGEPAAPTGEPAGSVPHPRGEADSDRTRKVAGARRRSAAARRWGGSPE